MKSVGLQVRDTGERYDETLTQCGVCSESLEKGIWGRIHDILEVNVDILRKGARVIFVTSDSNKNKIMAIFLHVLRV